MDCPHHCAQQLGVANPCWETFHCLLAGTTGNGFTGLRTGAQEQTQRLGGACRVMLWRDPPLGVRANGSEVVNSVGPTPVDHTHRPNGSSSPLCSHIVAQYSFSKLVLLATVCSGSATAGLTWCA